MLIQRLGGFWEKTASVSRACRTEAYYAPIVLAGRREYLICQDCRHIVTEAVKIVPGTDPDCFRVSDLRRLVKAPEPNRAHDVSQAAIWGAVLENEEWLAAVNDLSDHGAEARGIANELERLVRFAGYPCDLARQKVYLDYLARRPLYEEENEARFDWLAGEGTRLNGIGSAPLIDPSPLL